MPRRICRRKLWIFSQKCPAVRLARKLRIVYKGSVCALLARFGGEVRIIKSLFRGIALERSPVLAGGGLAARALFFCLPPLLAAFALIFLLAYGAAKEIAEKAEARGAILRARAMGFALENVLRETRNQVLLLASAACDERKAERVLRQRAKRDGEKFREVAFVGLTPEDRFLLLNHKGQIIRVPANVAREAPGGPFESGKRPHHVSISRPLDVNYAMLQVDGDLENVAFQALRFSAAVYDESGNFRGVLSVALDLGALRDSLAVFRDGASGRAFFFDEDGWLLFQDGEPGEPLSSDKVRAGFRGDYGKPGFSRAFRPGPEHLNYWIMAADAQAGIFGRLAAPVNASTEDANLFSAGDASYAPVVWRASEGEPGRVIGGVAVLTDNAPASGATAPLARICVFAFLAAIIACCLCVWHVARAMARPLTAITNAINSGDPSLAPSRPLPRELRDLRAAASALMERLKKTVAAQSADAEARGRRWLRQPAAILPQASDAPRLVGDSPRMRSLLDQIEKAARTDADILVVGETGSGKELVAASIHNSSRRGAGPFISINCGALDETLLMDTLFGHVRGAFTEARSGRKGAFLAATGGTLLLDEIGNATPRVQQALLRALSTRRIRPLGSDVDVDFDARVIAATNAPLLDSRGGFRNDLYYRLAVITITTPPLREHKADIPALVGYFLGHIRKDSGTSARISRGALEKLLGYDWPGNVRELKNILVRGLAFSDGKLIMAEDLPLDCDQPDPEAKTPVFAEPETGGLNGRQAEMWRRLAPLGSFTRKEYEQMAGGAISSRTAQYDLRLFARLGLVRREGRGPIQSYIVCGDSA